MKKTKIVLALLCCLALTLTGCASQKTSEEQLTKITLGEVAHSVFYAPQYVALEKGFFAAEGLEIDLINLQGADKVMSALITNEIQIGLMGPEASVYVANQNLDDYAINFAQLTQRDGSFFVGREPWENFTFDQLTEAEIIGGRKGGAPEMTLEYVLKSNGLDIAVDDETQPINVRTDIQFAAMAGAFLSGEGDYVALFEPTATAVEKEGRGYILTAIGAHSGDIPFTTYSAAKSYLESNPEIIQKFTNAVYQGQLFVKNNDAATIAEIIHPHFEDISLEDLTTVVERYQSIDAWDDTPILEKSGLEKLMDVMALAGELDKRADYNMIVNTTFAERAVQENK